MPCGAGQRRELRESLTPLLWLRMIMPENKGTAAGQSCERLFERPIVPRVRQKPYVGEGR